MDEKLTKQLEDINKRILYQENIHQDVTGNPQMFMGSVKQNIVIIILLAGMFTFGYLALTKTANSNKIKPS